MKKSLKYLVYCCCLVLFLTNVFIVNSQELDENSYNPNSLRPIREADIMYKNTVWLQIDMREKQNEPFVAVGNELSKVIIDAVKNQILRPFKNDSLTKRMSLQEFLENLKIPEAGEIIEDDFGGGDWGGGGGWGSEPSTSIDGEENDNSTEEEFFFPNQIHLFKIKQDILFDKRRAKMYYDIQSIELIIPGELLPTGLDKTLAVFSYKELVENVFIDNPYAIWYNPKNIGENRNFADAFDLRLYAAIIIKYSNPKDLYIIDIYNNDQKLSLGKEIEYEHNMLNYEAQLWSY